MSLPPVSGDINARETAARFQKNCYFLSLLAAMSVSFAVDSLNCFRHSPSSSAKFEPSEDFSPRRDDASADRAAFLSGADFGIFASVSESFFSGFYYFLFRDFDILSASRHVCFPDFGNGLVEIFARCVFFAEGLGVLGDFADFFEKVPDLRIFFRRIRFSDRGFYGLGIHQALEKAVCGKIRDRSEDKSRGRGRYCDFCFHN